MLGCPPARLAPSLRQRHLLPGSAPRLARWCLPSAGAAAPSAASPGAAPPRGRAASSDLPLWLRDLAAAWAPASCAPLLQQRRHCVLRASFSACIGADARSPRPTQQTNKQRNFTPYPRDKEWKQLSLIQRGACTSALVRARSSVRSIRGGGTRHGLLLEMMTSSGGRARRCGAASSWQQGRGEERLRPVSKHEIKLSLREKRRKRARLLRTEAPTRPEEHRHHDRHRRDHRHPGRGARNRIRRHPPHRAQPPRAAHDRSAHRHEAM
jgi:hypothetical protein